MIQLSTDLRDFNGRISVPEMLVLQKFMSQSFNWAEISSGTRQELDAGISAVFLSVEGSLDWVNTLEAHRKYMDLHCTLEGTDVMALKPVEVCLQVKKNYVPKDDYLLFEEAPAELLEIPAGYYCLVPPADAHMALYGPCGLVRKIVFKIPVEKDATIGR